MAEFKPGDEVRTVKGCRNNGPGGVLVICETGKKWKDYDACLCRKQNGSLRLYLTKNIIHVPD